ncbi:MAG: hypothetical protein JWN29_2189 [Acidimicrobiales bacterium]|nr:hypothetical protein [Acidimicrobiales bacterium]
MPKQQTFDGTELDAVLARVRKEAGADAKIVNATKVRTGGLGGFFSKETFKVTVELPEPAAPAPASTPAPAAAPERAAAPLTPPPASIFDLADLVDEAEVDAVSVATSPPPPPSVEATVRPPAHVPSTEGPSFNAVLRRIASEAGAPLPEQAPPVFVESTPVFVPASAPARVALPACDRELLSLGIPTSMLPTDLSPGMAVAALLRSLRLPSVPPIPAQPGAVTVVIGERRAAARLAADVAGELSISKRDIWVAEPGPEGRPGRLVTAADAAAERRTWVSGPTVVALTAPTGARDLRWAESMLDALEPTAVWGVVDAGRKPEDVQAWSDALGGLDALALEHLEATVSPAAVLQLGIPVARIEGQKATPALWAVLLAERIAA